MQVIPRLPKVAWVLVIISIKSTSHYQVLWDQDTAPNYAHCCGSRDFTSSLLCSVPFYPPTFKLNGLSQCVYVYVYMWVYHGAHVEGGQRTSFGSQCSFYCGFRVLNSASQACTASTFTHWVVLPAHGFVFWDKLSKLPTKLATQWRMTLHS